MTSRKRPWPPLIGACLLPFAFPSESAASDLPLAAASEAEDEVYEAVAEVAPPPRQATERRLSAEQLERVPGTLGDPLRGIELLPGVARSSGGEPIVRGAAGHESAVFIDGSEVPFLYHFGGLRSVIHPRAVERVELYPGNFSARYGRATGGVIEATLRSPRPEAPHVELELSLIDSSALVETPLGERAALLGAVRRSNVDLAFDLFVPEASFEARVAPVYWDYQSVLRFDPSDGAELRLTLLGARDELELAFADPSAESASLRGSVAGLGEYHRAQLAYDSSRGPLGVSLQAYGGVSGFEQAVGPNDQAYFDLVEFGGRAEWTLGLSDELQAVFGVDVAGGGFEGAYRGTAAPALEGSLDVPSDERDTIVIDKTRVLTLGSAFYAEARYFAARGLALMPGVRVDHYHPIDELTVNPRLSQRLALGEQVTLRSGVGWFSQPPEYYESIRGVGNPEIEPYHALHVSSGVEWSPSEQLNLELEGFFKSLTHRVVATPGSAPPGFVNDGRGRVVGLELGGNYQSSAGFDAIVSYTLSRSERADRDQPWRLFDGDQTHVLGLALGYDLGAGWHAGARFRYITGNPVTPVIGSVYDAGADLYYPLYGRQNSARDPAFNQLDVRVDKRFQLGPLALTAYLDVQNAYAADNPEGFIYAYDYSERKAASGMPLFPNLGLRGEL